ncbi:hypothetical protein [Bradyrhizobium prioriisuperbiae]|uniref:hypothetical protein n=1 Tax=Bradyrhizobium prioriisuperbiae TaxID=2854389 RepID=UPI0028F0A446|nr:hypothetical protein [Bradyrhizobium prioritasuperba]
MTIDNDIHRNARSPLGALAHVLERIGLAVTGAVCGLFVSVPMARNDIDILGSVGFVVGMMLCGFTGFYLGIDMPTRMRLRVRPQTDRDAGAIELLSGGGTFLTAAATLVSIDLLIFGDTLSGVWGSVSGVCWLVGIGLQSIGGVLARLRRREDEQVR